MTFELLCMGIIALFVGFLICFSGYRLFLLLLPFWGFFAGFAIGAGAITGLFGDAFLATTTSWVVGFFTGLIFAVLSYLFYIVGVALLAGSFGYAVGVGFMGLIGVDFGLLVWIVGVVVGIVVAAATILLNIQKWVIVIATSFGGAAAITAVLLAVLGIIDPAALGVNAVKDVLQDSWLWLLLFLGLGIVGLVSQVRTTQNFVLEAPENRI
jgi:hypothetical protein